MHLKGEYSTRRVWLDGVELQPGESLKVFNHSPDGFNWGYGGSGPSQLALAICLGVMLRDEAVNNYGAFKRAYIATLPATDFEVTLPDPRLEFCTHCHDYKPGKVKERYSYGVYAGRLCESCCKGYRDNCGLDGNQGDPRDIDEWPNYY